VRNRKVRHVPQRVVVGVSNSADNRQALSWAVAEAGGTGRHLVVRYACPPKSALALRLPASSAGPMLAGSSANSLVVVGSRGRGGFASLLLGR
jgi:nucleotide-binding universal stress UspA family protein